MFSLFKHSRPAAIQLAQSTSKRALHTPRLIAANVAPQHIGRVSPYGDYRHRQVYSNGLLAKHYPRSAVFPPDSRDWTLQDKAVSEQSFQHLLEALDTVLAQANQRYCQSPDKCPDTLYFLNFHEHVFTTRAPLTETQYQQLMAQLLKRAKAMAHNVIAVIPTLPVQFDEAAFTGKKRSAFKARLLKPITIALQGGLENNLLMQYAKPTPASTDPDYDYQNGRYYMHALHANFPFDMGGGLGVFNYPVIRSKTESGKYFQIYADICLTHTNGEALEGYYHHWQQLSEAERQETVGFSHFLCSNTVAVNTDALAATHLIYNDGARSHYVTQPESNWDQYIAVREAAHISLSKENPFLQGYKIWEHQASTMGNKVGYSPSEQAKPKCS